jgi:3-deoxy-manno-octulosonate cytidylyltransferase (CMP-KDO synthetase)
VKTAIVIPARLESTRLEKKLVKDINGKPLIQWVYEKALKVKSINKVIIAVDCAELYDFCQGFGAEVLLTSANHQSGTDRIGEVAKYLSGIDIIINLQGDEPMIDPIEIQKLIATIIERDADIVTMYESLNNDNELFDFNVVKLVKSNTDKAIYFSRNAIPAQRDRPFKEWIKKHQYFKHRGIYGFKKEILLQLITLPQSQLEKAESLEQLRWLENGYRIDLIESNNFSIGIDTQEDLDRVRVLMKGN